MAKRKDSRFQVFRTTGEGEEEHLLLPPADERRTKSVSEPPQPMLSVVLNERKLSTGRFTVSGSNEDGPTPTPPNGENNHDDLYVDSPEEIDDSIGDAMDAKIKFSLSGKQNEDSRMKLYDFMISTFDDKQKFITMAKISEEIFSSVYTGELSIGDEKTVALLTDAFKVMSCENMQLRLECGKKDDGDDDEAAAPAPQAVQDAAKNMITTVFRTAIINSNMPHVLELRRFLILHRHPIMKYLMGVLRALTRSHMDQLQEFFAGDRIALREIEYTTATPTVDVVNGSRISQAAQRMEEDVEDEKLAKACLLTIVKMLKFNPDHVLRNNIVIVLCDLCIRYTLLVDRYVPIIASCLKDRSTLVRQQTLECLTILIKEAFIRWEGQIMYRFVSMILDEDRKIREYATFCLKDILFPQMPCMYYNHFVECLLYFNDVPRKYKSNDSIGDAMDAKIKFSLSGKQNEDSRMKLYDFMISTFDDKQKFITMAKISEEIFSSVYTGELSIGDEKTVALLTDAFKVMSCENMQLRLECGKKDDGDDDEAAAPAPQAVQDAAKNMITTVFRTAIINSNMPHVLELRRFLILHRHPIMKYLMGVLRALTRSHMDQLQEFFAGDRIALREIEYTTATPTVDVVNGSRISQAAQRMEEDVERSRAYSEMSWNDVANQTAIVGTYGQSTPIRGMSPSGGSDDDEDDDEGRGFDPDPVKKWKEEQKKRELAESGEIEHDEEVEDDDEDAEPQSADDKKLNNKLSDYDYLVGMALIKLSEEEKDKLLKESESKLVELKTLQGKSWADLWNDDLKVFLEALDKQEAKEKADMDVSIKNAMKKFAKDEPSKGKKAKLGVVAEVFPSKDAVRVEPTIDKAMKEKYEKIDKPKAERKPKEPKEPKVPKKPKNEGGDIRKFATEEKPKKEKMKKEEWNSDESEDDIGSEGEFSDGDNDDEDVQTTAADRKRSKENGSVKNEASVVDLSDDEPAPKRKETATKATKKNKKNGDSDDEDDDFFVISDDDDDVKPAKKAPAKSRAPAKKKDDVVDLSGDSDSDADKKKKKAAPAKKAAAPKKTAANDDKKGTKKVTDFFSSKTAEERARNPPSLRQSMLPPNTTATPTVDVVNGSRISQAAQRMEEDVEMKSDVATGPANASTSAIDVEMPEDAGAVDEVFEEVAAPSEKKTKEQRKSDEVEKNADNIDQEEEPIENGVDEENQSIGFEEVTMELEESEKMRLREAISRDKRQENRIKGAIYELEGLKMTHGEKVRREEDRLAGMKYKDLKQLAIQEAEYRQNAKTDWLKAIIIIKRLSL